LLVRFVFLFGMLFIMAFWVSVLKYIDMSFAVPVLSWKSSVKGSGSLLSSFRSWSQFAHFYRGLLLACCLSLVICRLNSAKTIRYTWKDINSFYNTGRIRQDEIQGVILPLSV
jgi:hypothetical protein